MPCSPTVTIPLQGETDYVYTGFTGATQRYYPQGRYVDATLFPFTLLSSGATANQTRALAARALG